MKTRKAIAKRTSSSKQQPSTSRDTSPRKEQPSTSRYTPPRKEQPSTSRDTSPRKQQPSTSSDTSPRQQVPSTLANTSSISNDKTSKRKRTMPKKTKPFTHVVIRGKKFKVTRKLLKEIVKLQSSTSYLIPKLPFARLIKELFLDAGTRGNNFKVQVAALDVLQTAAEMYMTDFFEDSNLCASHCKRITLLVHDMLLAQKLRK